MMNDRDQEPAGMMVRQFASDGISSPAGPCPKSHSMFPVIVPIVPAKQFGAELGHGARSLTHTLSPESKTPA
jgi:hypothetical protein